MIEKTRTGDRSPAAAGSVAVLDIGGTTMSAGVVDETFGLVGAVADVASNADATSPEPILGTLTQLISKVRDVGDANGHRIDLLVVCAPAPFDYAAGRSLMTHKFGALFELDLRSVLEEASGCEVAFVNDADAYAAGAWVKYGKPEGRAGGLTLGTGLGSAFLVNGDPIHDGPDVPDGGEIWSLRYEAGIVEDYVSSNAIRVAYGEGGGGVGISVEEIAGLAREGDPAASAAFADYGRHLGRAIVAGFGPFAPQRLAVGGKIVHAWDLFGPLVEQAVAEEMDGPLTVAISAAGDEAFVGGRHLGRRQQAIGLLDRRSS